MQIQQFEPIDIKSLPNLQPEDWGNITPAFQFYLTSQFCFPLKVIIDNKMVGVGAAIIHNEIAWLAHIIVHPDYRKKGIGKTISQTLVDNSKSHHCETIYLIATELGAPVYAGIGFETETEYLMFKGLKIGSTFPVSKNITAIEDKFREQIIDMDKQITGECRRHHLEEHLSNAYVYQAAGTVEGYYLPTFGEGLIIANNSIAGIELMKFRLIKKENAIIPFGNKTAIDFLHNQNIKESRSVRRMRLGLKRTWQPANIYNRMGGNMG